MTTTGDLKDKFDKKYGAKTFVKGIECGRDYPRIPTGIFAIDYMTGGGLPLGVTSSIYGPPGGGKTLVVMKVAQTVQNLCFSCMEYKWDCNCGNQKDGKVVFVSTEIFDIEWAAILGIDPETIWVAEPDSGEIGIDIICDNLKAEDVGIVILDSLPMLVPTEELESAAIDAHMALQARMIAKFIRKMKAILVRQRKIGHNVAFLTTNQIRAKIGGYGAGEEVPGGFTSKHDWHLTIRMSQLKSSDIDQETDLPIHGKFRASMLAMGNKRKLFTLAGSSEFLVTLGDGGLMAKGTVNDYETVVKYAANAGLLDKTNWTLFGETYGTKKDMLNHWLIEDEEFLSIKRKLIKHFITSTKENYSILNNVENNKKEG